MSYMQENPYQYSGSYGNLAAYAEEAERTAFIRRTYVHLLAAVFAFAGLEAMFFALVPAELQLKTVVMMRSGWNALFVLGGFVFVSWIAERWATSAQSLTMQYIGLSLYVLAESVIFLPILFMANRMDPMSIPSAAIITAFVFGGLTLMVLVTRADFSWLGRFLWLGGLVAMGLVVCSIFFGFSLGMIFAAVMVAFACGYILYDTSNVMHRYSTTQHVAAALALFASVAMLFYYILRIVMSYSREE